MKKRVEVSVKMLQVRVYGEDDDQYESVLHAYLDGRKGFLFSLKGEDFYSGVDEVVEALGKYGVTEFYGSVMPKHGAAIQEFMGDRYDVDLSETTEVAGRVANFAKIKKKVNKP